MKYVKDMSVNSIDEYLDALDVARETNLILLKSVKAVLSLFHSNEG
ncbi:hypothetical protein [Viridibacillus arvi]|nr:hypothetical protein [Viridibacillus arvi]